MLLMNVIIQQTRQFGSSKIILIVKSFNIVSCDNECDTDQPITTSGSYLICVAFIGFALFKNRLISVFVLTVVPSLPPTDIRAYNTSSTSLTVTWNPVPQGYTHGIVLGYLVFYKRQQDLDGNFINASSLVFSADLEGLDKFTVYVVKVLAFTIKGNGVISNETSVKTHEDGG